MAIAQTPVRFAALKAQKFASILAFSQRNMFYHFRCSFPPHGQDDIAECFGIEACLAVCEVILTHFSFAVPCFEVARNSPATSA